ncbi:hypothetical protein HP467_01850 [Curtobacterium albidum]|uniref:Uncharacterized protein n=1 Tax=Curtobacterium citreum TaxID=2036 RepID=A0A850DQK7_9MICO|nr:hypothetical protein [Curtobacterium albidum]NUU26858.1 hypothetical protein [Curtobacterium albidum]
MTRTYTPDELRTIRAAIHAAAAQRHAAENARGRSAVEDDPTSMSHRVGVATWMIEVRHERIAEDEATLAPHVEHGNGREWTFHLMHRIEAHASEVAYWEGVREAVIARAMFQETSV